MIDRRKCATRRLCFLLGAGVSVSAGFAPTDTITNRVRSKEPIICGTNETHIWSPTAANRHVHGDGADRARQVIETVAAMLWGGNQCPNYEDLYFAVNEIHEHLRYNYDNPCLEPLIAGLMEKVDWGDVDRDPREGLEDAASEACDLIRSVVAQWLSGTPESTHLNLLIDIIRARQFQRVDIFTLNHDCHIETALQEAKLAYEDGFRPIGHKDVHAWSRAHLEQDSSYVTLCKLHGSVDWYRAQIEGYCFEDVLIRTRDDVEHLGQFELPQGRTRPYVSPDDRQILVGRHNKILSYTGGWYLELYYWFKRRLEHANTLVVSGYSFGDKGINSAIIDAFAPCDPSRLLIVIDPSDESDLVKKARYAIAGKWNTLKSRGRLTYVQCDFGSVKLDDLRDAATPR
mgnify:CR=1 FL=1